MTTFFGGESTERCCIPQGWNLKCGGLRSSALVRWNGWYAGDVAEVIVSVVAGPEIKLLGVDRRNTMMFTGLSWDICLKFGQCGVEIRFLMDPLS